MPQQIVTFLANPLQQFMIDVSKLFYEGIATMKLALAQISMASNMQENLEKSLLFCDQANGTDLLFFPEIQLSPFPQYEKGTLTDYCLQPDSVEISKLKEKAAQQSLLSVT